MTTRMLKTIRASPIVQGPWLMPQMEAQARHVGTEILSDHIVEVNSTRGLLAQGRFGRIYTCDALIIATGAQAGWGSPPSIASRVSGLGLCHLGRLFLIATRK